MVGSSKVNQAKKRIDWERKFSTIGLNSNLAYKNEIRGKLINFKLFYLGCLIT